MWDVGANVGHYTTRIADRVENGRVFAFEPSPVNVVRLRNATHKLSNVSVIEAALADRIATMRFEQGTDPLGATSKLAGDSNDSGTEVRVTTGDAVVSSGEAAMPAVVKIDTEGYELEVLRGMIGLLGDPTLRTIAVEVHFGVLAERGIPEAPREIERMLTEARFTCRWIDASHVVASR
ncbi:MAG: FkbM family methyltransferase [Thermoanaerobaculia bacterium]